MKSEKIKLFGYDLLLTTRIQDDADLYRAFVKDKNLTYSELKYADPLYLEQGLKYNITKCCFKLILLGKEIVVRYRFLRYLKLKKILSASYLSANLHLDEFSDLIKKLYFLETGEDLEEAYKKKVETNQTAKESAEKQPHI